MKILYFFPEKNSIMSNWQRVHFINELAMHNVIIDTFNPLLYSSWEEANKQVLKKLESEKYDVFFTWVCNDELLYIDTLQKIKNIGIPTLLIRFDNLVIPLYDKKMAPLFDLVWLTSNETKRFYDKWGVRSYFAPYAANPYVFHYTEKPLIRQVCFVGTPYGSRSKMLNTLISNNVNLTVFSGNSSKEKAHNNTDFHTIIELPKYNRLESVCTRMRFKEGRTLIKGMILNRLERNRDIISGDSLIRMPSVPTDILCDVYSEYALSLASTSAHHTDVLKKPLKIINLRNFEIPMSGGVEICRFNQELAGYFEENKEIIFYRNNEELIDKSRYYLYTASEKELSNIKNAARLRAENEHTWYHRFKSVFNELGIII